MKIVLISSILFSVLLTSCGGSGGGSSTSPDTGGGGGGGGGGDSAQNCGTTDGAYYDSGMATGLKLKPGQMPSDIADIGISACSQGQFVFNGSCWDSVSFNDASGEVDFTKSSVSNVILKPEIPLSALMNSYALSINKFIKRCDVLDPPGTSTTCTPWMGHYPSIYSIDKYSINALLDWEEKITPTNYIAMGLSTFKLRTQYGTCFKNNGQDYNTYDWYTNGRVNLAGNNVSLPLSKSTFNSIYPSNYPIQCPYIYSSQWICYQVNTSWGSEILSFDENNNLNTMYLNYN